MPFLFKGTLVLPGGVQAGGAVLVRGGQIVAAGALDGLTRHPVHGPQIQRERALTVVEAPPGGLVCPGFIDLHVHGGGGADFMDGDVEAALTVARTHARHGTTALLATTLTAPGAAIAGAVEAARAAAAVQQRDRRAGGAAAGAAILGCHLEGPYLNPAYKGAHDPRYLRAADLAEVTGWLDLWPGAPAMVSLAPECDGALPVVAALKGRAVPAAAHTGATMEQMAVAAAAGVAHVAHLHNAMPGLHHRQPGVVGAALSRPDLSAELIADGVHVHPVVLALTARLLGSRLTLVTDAMRAAGLPAGGRHRLGDLQVTVTGGAARLAGGTLAGSVLTLDRAVANAVRLAGLDAAAAVAAAASQPARVLGIAGQRGSLAAGQAAAITVLDRQMQSVFTLVEGAVAYDGR